MILLKGPSCQIFGCLSMCVTLLSIKQSSYISHFPLQIYSVLFMPSLELRDGFILRLPHFWLQAERSKWEKREMGPWPGFLRSPGGSLQPLSPSSSRNWAFPSLFRPILWLYCALQYYLQGFLEKPPSRMYKQFPLKTLQILSVACQNPKVVLGALNA